MPPDWKQSGELGRMDIGGTGYDMMMRVLEAVSGVLASLVGGGTLAYLVFVPVYRGIGCVSVPGEPTVCDATYATLLNGSELVTNVQLGLVAALLLAVGTAAVWHARTQHGGARAALYAATGVLAIWTICPLLVPGVTLLPSIALAIVACVVSAAQGSEAAAQR